MSGVPIARCAQSRRLGSELWALIAGDAPPVPRYALVAAAAGLAHEHHSSIVRLVEIGNFGTAAALMRPLVEAATTAAWALYVPAAATVEGLFWDTARLPKPNTMQSHLAARPELQGKLDLKALMDGAGSVLHKYTHGDMDQLRRRFRVSGPTFNLHENTGTLLVADLIVLLTATIYEVTKRSDALKTFLRDRSDAIVDEIRAAAGMSLDEWKGWNPLPDPVVPVGEIPEALRGVPLGAAAGP